MEKNNYFVDWAQKGKRRPEQHITGETGVSILKDIFPKEWVVREYVPDYGIDLDVELFEDIGDKTYRTLGEHILFQVKGTKELIKKTITLYSRMNVEKKYKENK